MTQTEIYRYINALWNTDSMGGAFNLKEYNDAQKEVNTTMFTDAVEELYTNQKGALPELVYSSKMLRPFVTEATVVPITGVITLNTQLTNYAYLLKLRTSAAYLGQIRQIPLIDYGDLASRFSNILRPR